MREGTAAALQQLKDVGEAVSGTVELVRLADEAVVKSLEILGGDRGMGREGSGLA